MRPAVGTPPRPLVDEPGLRPRPLCGACGVRPVEARGRCHACRTYLVLFGTDRSGASVSAQAGHDAAGLAATLTGVPVGRPVSVVAFVQRVGDRRIAIGATTDYPSHRQRLEAGGGGPLRLVGLELGGAQRVRSLAWALRRHAVPSDDGWYPPAPALVDYLGALKPTSLWLLDRAGLG